MKKLTINLFTGDRVKFTLSRMARLNAGSFFVGTVIDVAKLWVTIEPSNTAKRKLRAALNSKGYICVDHECCHIYSIKKAEVHRLNAMRKALGAKVVTQSKKRKKRAKIYWQYPGKI